MGLDRTERLEMAKFLRKARVYALEDAYLMAEERVYRGGGAALGPPGHKEEIAAKDAKYAARWLKLAQLIYEVEGIGDGVPERTGVKKELGKALKQVLIGLEEDWNGLLILGMGCNHEDMDTWVNGWLDFR